MFKYFHFVSLFSAGICIIFVDQTNTNSNPEILNVTLQFKNDGIHDTVFKATVETFVDIEKVLAIISIRIPENANDKNYQKEFIKTSIDFQKFIEGVQGSFIAKAIMENIYKSIDFEPKFPFKKGIYRINNFTLAEKYIPIPNKMKALVEARYVGKITGKKPTVYFYSFKTVVEFK